MATLLNEATDSWSFDKLIQPLSNPNQLAELLSYLNGKHKSYQHDHIDPIALSRILIAIKFVSSKKKLFTVLKPSIDELIHLCHSILNALKNEKKLSKSCPWLWLDTILTFMNAEESSVVFPWIDIADIATDLSSMFDGSAHFLFPEWCFATKNGIKLFKLVDNVGNDNNDKIEPKSRTLSNVSFLSFPRPNPPQSMHIKSPLSMTMKVDSNGNTMRKRQKTSLSSFYSIGAGPALNETDRKRKFSAINDKLSKMMNKKNGQKNSIRLLSIQQKRQMREDSDRREQERKLQIEQVKKEKERLKKLEKEKLERDDKEKQQLSLLDNINDNDDFNDDLDFDAFMDDANGADDNNDNQEELRLIEMGIPKHLQKFTWLYTNCNSLDLENRDKIVQFLTGKYTKDGVEKEDILLNRSTDSEKGLTKDNIFRMFFTTKKWKKIVLSRRVKKKKAS